MGTAGQRPDGRNGGCFSLDTAIESHSSAAAAEAGHCCCQTPPLVLVPSYGCDSIVERAVVALPREGACAPAAMLCCHRARWWSALRTAIGHSATPAKRFAGVLQRHRQHPTTPSKFWNCVPTCSARLGLLTCTWAEDAYPTLYESVAVRSEPVFPSENVTILETSLYYLLVGTGNSRYRWAVLLVPSIRCLAHGLVPAEPMISVITCSKR